MSGNFKLDDYVDVAERIREFSAKYPDGSLQSEIVIRDNGVLCKAFAYRTAQDEKPGIGHAFEPIPGKTPYTKDSEVMNAETSAWGRAIVALGFDTKKIASKQEVVARQDNHQQSQTTYSEQIPEPVLDELGHRAPASPNDPPATDKQKAMLSRLIKKLGLTPEQVANDIGDVDTISKRAASSNIERLLKLEENREAPPAASGKSDDDIPF